MTATVVDLSLSSYDHRSMTPGGYGTPPAPLFNSLPPYMEYYGNMHLGNPAAAAADPYAPAPLFGTPAPAASVGAGYLLYQSPSSQAGLGPADDIRTVFISGLPHDVKERELHNLLRFMPGYEASQMNWKTGGPQGFALFTTASHALAMVDILSGMQFDDGVLLRAEMAHKNMFIKPEDPSVKRASKPSSSAVLGPANLLTPMAPSALGPAPLSQGGPAYLAAAAAAAAAAAVAGSPTSLHPQGVLGPLRPATFSPVTNLRDNPPCNTLFIGNLGDTTSEQEIRALLGSQPGYRQLKMVRGTKSTTAFVEFSDVASAMLVHDTLQGAVLSSSDRGGIRIQYSKNPFGRRDFSPSSPGVASGVISAGSPGHKGLAAALGTGHSSPRALSGPGGILTTLSSGGSNVGASVAGGALAPVLVGQAGLERILGGDM